MKLKFKVQPYQTAAVQAVVDCFAGQPYSTGAKYRIDPGKAPNTKLELEGDGFKNAELQLTDKELLNNIQTVQRSQNLNVSNELVKGTGSQVNLDVEMETGTGKTYCYIKTMFELNKQYGWNKFIVMVPSIAIREGVYKSLEITAEHFSEAYGKKIRAFIYNSKQLHHIESFSSDSGINVMVINIQAFNAKGADNRRIYEELDDFQSRRPIDVIGKNRPILILDEPQKMGGAATMKALPEFKPLAILRYSATHNVTHNKIHRLDALDAYNQKLVKKISVRGIQIKGLAGSHAYLYLESIEISKEAAPIARMEIEQKLKTGEIKRKLLKLGKGDNLFDISNKLDQYKDFVISDISYNEDKVEFTNGHVLTAGDATGDVNESTTRRIQIRETIKAHFEKEQLLHGQGIKVLSLFFIDEVAKYRDYNQPEDKGDYARIFEEEYESVKAEYLSELPFNDAYHQYLKDMSAASAHEGYFSIDKKTKRFKDPETEARTNESNDTDAYDLILKNKERLLSFAEPVRFIFSHSALREGWDNPNVFVMCMLKHSDNTTTRRQEVGRGLRLCVNQNGDRMDNPATVHEINILTVVANESYKDFVKNLQGEILDSISSRPRQADKAYFIGKLLKTPNGIVQVDEAIATQIYRYLILHSYTDNHDHISDKYHIDKSEGTLKELPADLLPFKEGIFELIDSVFSTNQLPEPTDDRKPKPNPLNANFDKKEFQELWNRINKKAVYRVEFNSEELIKNCIHTLNKELEVSPLQYMIQQGIQEDKISEKQLKQGEAFEVKKTETELYNASILSSVEYDLLGKISENVELTRHTIAQILMGIENGIFDKFRKNPEHFISEASRLIKEQKATIIIEQLSYDEVSEKHNVDIFTAGTSRQDFTNASAKLKKHIYDYLITDSGVEKRFAEALETSSEVVVYAKLPSGFKIPTPVGDYNPDWAISFKEGSVQHIYFVAETKGSLSSMDLRKIEATKIECARKFFERINKTIPADKVKYDFIDGYGKLMDVAGLKKRAS